MVMSGVLEGDVAAGPSGVPHVTGVGTPSTAGGAGGCTSVCAPLKAAEPVV
jgi:hypothetical protein